MGSAERRQYALSRLEDHRHLLRSAVGGMTRGDLTQVLHVAVTIRVLVHETGSQTPLLKQLKANFLDLPIREWFNPPPEPPPPGVSSITFYCPISANITINDGKTTVSLNPDMSVPEYKASTLGAWWAHPCMVLPGLGPFGRGELILSLADKEAAHVDHKVGYRYKQVLESQFLRMKLDGDDAALNISRLVGGKCGVEMLEFLDTNFPPPPAPAARA